MVSYGFRHSKEESIFESLIQRPTPLLLVNPTSFMSEFPLRIYDPPTHDIYGSLDSPALFDISKFELPDFATNGC